MANPLKKNTRNDKRSKPSNAARPETANRGAQSAANSPVAAQPPTATRLPSQEEVEKRAYQIFQARGGEHGRHLEDWEQAEQELKLCMQ